MKCPKCTTKSLMLDFDEQFMTATCDCGFKENLPKRQYKFNQYNTGRAWVIWIRERQEPHRMLKDDSTVGEWKDWKELKYPGTVKGLAQAMILLLTQFESQIVETQSDLLKQLSDLEQTIFYCTDRIVDAIKDEGLVND